MTNACATALRLAAIGLLAAALGGCIPLFFDRDGNWRGAQPTGPAYGNNLQPDAGVGSVTDTPVRTGDEAEADTTEAAPAE
ncbi:MAG: hypothetical protein R3F55_12310 [Alphaproteobacteria bacterium]